MSNLLIVLAVAAMIGVAAARLVRVRLGRTPLPEGRDKLILVLAIVVVPPMAMSPLVDPVGGVLGGLAWLPLYVAMFVGLAIVMSLTAQLVGFLARGRLRRLGALVVLALVGDEGDPDAAVLDPPITVDLAQSVANVDRANVAFPRGPEFPAQIERAGFRSEWDALDAATATLEDRIANDGRLGLTVARAASATAQDARNRLDTLRRMAGDHGQAWARP